MKKKKLKSRQPKLYNGKQWRELTPEEKKEQYKLRGQRSAATRAANKAAKEAREAMYKARGQKSAATKKAKAAIDPEYKRQLEKGLSKARQTRHDNELARKIASGKYHASPDSYGDYIITDDQGEIVEYIPKKADVSKQLEDVLDNLPTFEIREEFYEDFYDDYTPYEPAEPEEDISEEDKISDKINELADKAGNDDIANYIKTMMEDLEDEFGKEFYENLEDQEGSALLSMAEKAFNAEYKEEIKTSVRALIGMLIPGGINVNSVSSVMEDVEYLLEASTDYRKKYDRTEWGRYDTMRDGTPRNKKY